MIATPFKYRDAEEFELHEYVVMPAHIHLLLSIADEQHVSRPVQLIKGGFSHSLREAGIFLRAVGQPRYYDRRVRDPEEYGKTTKYILENPARRGLVESASDYPYSSAARQFRLNEPPTGLKPLIAKEEVYAGLKAGSTKFALKADG